MDSRRTQHRGRRTALFRAVNGRLISRGDDASSVGAYFWRGVAVDWLVVGRRCHLSTSRQIRWRTLDEIVVGTARVSCTAVDDISISHGQQKGADRYVGVAVRIFGRRRRVEFLPSNFAAKEMRDEIGWIADEAKSAFVVVARRVNE